MRRLWCYRHKLITDRAWCHWSCRLEGKVRDGLLWAGLWLSGALYDLFWKANRSFDRTAHVLDKPSKEEKHDQRS